MSATVRDPMVGRVVGDRYLVESLIASGGMASVYLALDRRLDRQVALKVMHANLAADPEFVTRFVGEAKAAARLSHPNVVQVFDQGSDAEILFLAMEYLPGRTLRDVLAGRGALTPRESLSALEPVFGALAAAHRAGIVHGDVKPENVILTNDGRIKVADFGLARAITAPITVTAGGELLGTVAYLAPELVSHGTADARADVYAAGIMLFELLTGRQPFTGSDPLEVAYRHVRENVPAPTSVSVEIPAAFDPVVLRATDHDPGRRQPNAGALLAELQSALARVSDAQLDLRAADPLALRVEPEAGGPDAVGTMVVPLGQMPLGHEARTEVFSAVPAAAQPQRTQVLAVPRRQARAEAAAGPDRPKLLPRSRPIEGDPVPESRVAGRGPLLAIIGAVVVVLLVIFTGIWWATAGPGSYLDAPSLAGKRQTDAQRALTEQGLTSRVTFVYSAKTAAGQVISTNPAGGARLKKKGNMVLTVSKGPQLFAVPDVSNQSVADATAAIKKAHLAVGDTTTAYNAAVSPGQVISTSPKSGTKLVSGRKVDLVVARAATIRGVNSGRCLDVPNGSQNDGTQTVLQDCTGSESQSWVATPAQQLTVFGGAKCLDVAGGATNDGAIVQIYTCNGGTNQQWVINPDGSILGVGSGKCLDATDHGTDNGTPMQIWDCTGGDNQKWSR